jgi:hypothetical protein
MDRREAIAWMLAATGATLLGRAGPSVPPGPDSGGTGRPPGAGWVGYGGDPDLLKDYHPGELWPLTFSPAERRCAGALCDVILPADGQSPAASAVGVPDFIDEWISAPYAWIGGRLGGPEADPKADRAAILEGLGWLDAESRRRFGPDFAGSIHSQQTALCDPICHEPAAEAALKPAARFFRRFRELAMTGYYTSKEGMRDLNYVGNVAQASFDGPPAEVLRRVGLE